MVNSDNDPGRDVFNLYSWGSHRYVLAALNDWRPLADFDFTCWDHHFVSIGSVKADLAILTYWNKSP